MVPLMITFKEFLTEGEMDAEKAAILIKTNCKPFLKAMGGVVDTHHAMWRGMRDFNGAELLEKTVRKDRAPKSSSAAIHHMLDNWFAEHLGPRFRTQSMFCTGFKEGTSMYGNPYMVFPIGQFQYAWSREIQDAYAFFENSMGFTPHGFKEICKANKIVPDATLEKDDQGYPKILQDTLKWIRMCERYLDSADPYKFNKGLSDAAALALNNEIMIECDRYYALLVPTPRGAGVPTARALTFAKEVLKHVNSK